MGGRSSWRGRASRCSDVRVMPVGRRAEVIKVLLVDDEELVRSGLRLILGTADDIEVVHECSDGSQVFEAVRRYRPDVVLLDIRMQGANGLTAMERLRMLPDPPRVAVLTTFDVDDYV